MRETSTGETAAFVSNVVLDGAVENWLVELEHAMKKSMQQLLAVSIQAHRGKDKEKWITDVQGQLLINTGSIQWTNDCSKALGSISNGKKNALRQLKKKQVAYLTRLTDMIRGQLPRLVRTKLVALITMEIHNRDVMERMIKAGCSSVTDFDWLCQLRFLFNKEEGQFGGICTVRQTNCNLDYGYEYQGNNGRLVVTPLTDRCVLTLLTAKFLNRGGNPLGPAGTGKTETVKDLSKNLAMYCVVINCSDGREPESIQKAYWGPATYLRIPALLRLNYSLRHRFTVALTTQTRCASREPPRRAYKAGPTPHQPTAAPRQPPCAAARHQQPPGCRAASS